jgi:hypothetical protein
VSRREIWQYYWNPILLLLFAAGQLSFFYYMNSLPGPVFPQLAAWPLISTIVGYCFGLFSLMLAFAFLIHVMFISWVTVAIEAARGIFKVVTRKGKSISKHGFLSGACVAFIYAGILVYISHEMTKRY